MNEIEKMAHELTEKDIEFILLCDGDVAKLYEYFYKRNLEQMEAMV